MHVLFLIGCLKLAGGGCSAPHLLFGMDTSPEQAALSIQGYLPAPLRETGRMLYQPWSPLPASFACRAVVTFAQDSIPTCMACIRASFTIFCHVVKRHALLFVWWFTAQLPVRRVWDAQMEAGVCTVAGRATGSCSSLMFQSTPTQAKTGRVWQVGLHLPIDNPKSLTQSNLFQEFCKWSRTQCPENITKV